jgi:chitodextrinase
VTSVQFHIPAGAQPSTGSDHHMVVINTDTGQELDMWVANYDATTKTWSDDSFAIVDAQNGNGTICASAGCYTGADAAGTALMGGVLTPTDFSSGQINHALALTTPLTKLGEVACPAVHTDGTHTDAYALPEGSHLQLSPSFNIAAQNWAPWQKTLATALQKYGAYINDTGGSLGFYGLGNGNWASAGISSDPSAYSDPNLSWFPWNQMRVLSSTVLPYNPGSTTPTSVVSACVAAGAGPTSPVTTSPPQDTPPSAPTGLSASAANSAQVNLSWGVPTSGSAPTSYVIYRNGSSTPLATIPAPTTSYQDSAVSANTSYSYQVAAVDAAGNQGSDSAAATAKTPPTPDKTPPSVPQKLHTTGTTTTSISLAWNASTDNAGGSGLAGYHVYRNGVLLSAKVTTNKFTDTGLAPDTTYSYAVSAYDNAANGSVASAVITPKTAAPPAPGDPTHLTASAASSAQINLSWSAPTTGSAPSSYAIYRNGSSTALATVPATTTSYQDTAVSADTSYSYQVAAVDVYGSQGPDSSTASTATPPTPDHTPPSVPTGLTVTERATTAVSFSWTASTDTTGGSGLAGYHVYRNGVLLSAKVTTNKFTDTGLAPDTIYTYTVSAYDNAANGSTASAPLKVTTLKLPQTPPDSTPPTKPLDLHATGTTDHSISLRWKASTDSGGSGMDGYFIYRNNKLIISVTGTSFTNRGLVANTHYVYKVVAHDHAGNLSPDSAPLSVTTKKAPPHHPHKWWPW